MEMLNIAIYSLLCVLFLTITGSVHVAAFSSQLSSSIQTIQQEIPGPGMPEQQQQEQVQSPEPPQQPPSLPSQSSLPASSRLESPSAITQQQQQRASEGIIARGIIDSLIFTPSATWIATGNWTIGVNNGNVALVSTNMTRYNDNGTSSHTHEILNFRPIEGQVQQPILVQPEDNSISLRGIVDVGANHRTAWNDVQNAIDIKKGGKILSILLNDTQTNNHFGGRPIFGIVTSFTHCSDVPGPNMEMMPPCLNIPITSPSPQLTAPSNAPPVSPPKTLANNTVQNPTNLTASSPPPSSLPPANITTGTNATGKSPFDILGGG